MKSSINFLRVEINNLEYFGASGVRIWTTRFYKWGFGHNTVYDNIINVADRCNLAVNLNKDTKIHFITGKEYA